MRGMNYNFGGVDENEEETGNDQRKDLLKQSKEGFKQQLISSGANMVGAGADIATQYLSKDMVYGKGAQIAGQAADMLEEIPLFGNTVKVIRMGANAAGRAISKDINTFDYNPELAAKLGPAYNFKKYDELKQNNGKKAVWWKANEINKNNSIASQQINTLSQINTENQMRLGMQNGNNLLNYQTKLNGGNNNISIGKKGLKVDLVKRVKNIKHRINVNTKEIEEFENGGKLIPEIVNIRPIIMSPIKKFQTGGKTTRSLEELIKYAQQENPRFIQRLSEAPKGIKFIDDEGNESNGSHYLEWSTDETGNAIIYPRIQEMEDGSLKFLSTEDAYRRAMQNKNILRMSQEEANTFFGEDPEYVTAYNRGWPEFFKKFQKGGSIKESEELVKLEETNQKNVIPEGALHKNKHHMEHTDGLTQKGIPVIDEKGEQQAEIELNEIIFTLEVTKKLEKLHEIYKEGSAKEKDEAAIEAGKLLVQEILYNTDDRTGLIDKCQKGGKLNGFK